jgi:hypothetical protein
VNSATLTTNTPWYHVGGCSCACCAGDRDTAPHGTRARYDAGCPCVPCREANTARHRVQREERYALRVPQVIDGVTRMVAAHLPPEKHGRPGTRGNWGCECNPCRSTQSRRCKDHRCALYAATRPEE